MCSYTRGIYDYVVVIVPLVLSAAIGLIGWFQYKINKHKLRLDLYNKRFVVYEKALAYFQSYYSNYATLEQADSSAREFIRAYRESVFLFGEDCAVYRRLTELKDTLGFLFQFDEKFKSEPYDRDEYSAWSEMKQSKPDPRMLMQAFEKELLPWLDFRKVEK